MKIGLVGYGKMGSEIFSVLFDSLKNTQFIVVSLYDLEKSREGVEKLLARQLKRKRLSQEVYEAKLNSFTFTDDYNALSDCDAVIECAFEDMAVKKDIFNKLAAIVSDECLLLTNTSSLDISEVFSSIPHRERCLGMHFFYPVKLSGFTELNYLTENTADVLDRAESLITAAGKRTLRFAGDYHIYLNQILALCISHSIHIAKKAGATAEQFDTAVKDIFPFAGPFGIIDTIGLGLMAKSPAGFRIARNRSLLRYGSDAMNEWYDNGCPGEPGLFLDYLKKNQTETDCDTRGFSDSVLAVVMNEAVFAAKESGCEKDSLLDAVADVLGLSGKLAEYYHSMGYEKIKTILDKLADDMNFEIYKAADKSDFDNVF